jgi:predicted nucleotide-binding protein
LQSELEREYDIEIWNQSQVFGLGTVTIEALEEAVSKYDFGLFVFTPDDEIKNRDSTKPAARDNVIFESGLFIGKLGRHRSFIIKPRGIVMQMPSDLQGLMVADYDGDKQNKIAAVGAACNKIRAAIDKQATA